MAWQSDTINPAVTTPASDISKITNDLSVLRSTFNNVVDPDVPLTLPLLNHFYVVFREGLDGSHVSDALIAAALESDNTGKPLLLPPWTVRFRKSFRCNKIVGFRGMSVLLPEEPFDASATFGNEFIITNRNFTQAWNPATAEDCMYRDFEMRIAVGKSGIGIAGTIRSRFEGLRLKAERALVDGKARAVGALIDYYCLNRSGVVFDCDLINDTGAYGASLPVFSPDGGACIWVRNFRESALPTSVLQSTAPADVAAVEAEAEEWVTEGIAIHGNRMTHMTSDEVWSLYGVTGIVRKCRVHDNKILGLPSIGGVHHASFCSVFPLRFNSGGALPRLDALGRTAGVYQNDVYNNDIEDAAAMYDIFRIGLSTDPQQKCYDNKSWNNRVRWRRSADPVTGPKAVWVAAGSPGGPTLDPDILSAAIKCVDGQFGLAYFSDTSGNTSTDDAVISDGTATVNFGFQGFQRVADPEVRGNVFIGAGSCRFVFGGKVEAAGACFVNCRSVVGTNYRQNLPGGVVYEINDGQPGVYGLKDTVGESYGRLISVGGNADSASTVGVYNNDVQFIGGASTQPILQNLAAPGGATIRARNNTSRGASASITGGPGTINRSSNDWNGTLD
jgi:hypothetical protein